MHPWLTSLEEIRVEDLLVPMAQDFVKFVSTYGEGAAIIDGVRRLKAGEEVVLLRVITGRPQRPPYAIMREEPLGILFSADEHFPYIMSAREDFPDTPHQNTPPPGTPFSLCIDDRDWAEARITYTPAELLQRIVSWFEKAGKDELHAVTQPLDPYFFGGTYTLILPGPVFELEPNDRCDLITIRADEKAKLLQLDYSREIDPSKIKEGTSRCVFVTYEVRPELMARMRAAPGTLALLDTELKTRGISLLEDLADKITAWSAEEDEWKRFRLESRLGILLKMPILHPKNGLTGADSIIAFVTNCPLGDVGVSLGRLSKSCVGCDEFPYVLTVPSDPIDYAKLEQTRLMPWNVVTSFDPDLAARMAGRKDQDSRAIVMVGAGAVGSLVANSLAREGRSNWTIIDTDSMLPHNLARHVLSQSSIGYPKALCMQFHLQEAVRGCGAKGIVANVLAPNNKAQDVERAMLEAEIIMDASASVPVSRHLCDLKATARRVAFFFNPAGTSAVLMVEDVDRNVDLRAIEAIFYSQILIDPSLAQVLVIPPERIPYSGDCRAMTTRMPSSRAQILSGLIAQELSKALDEPHASLKVWQLSEDGSVTTSSHQPEPLHRYDLADWTVRLLPSVANGLIKMRLGKLPNETGGALLGVVDIPAKRIEVMGALPPPPDSEEEPSGFLRGTVGLKALVTQSMGSTLDHIRYVGEWHSHPKGCNTSPSTIDLVQLAILSETLSADGCPGVQVILGDAGLRVHLGVTA